MARFPFFQGARGMLVLQLLVQASSALALWALVASLAGEVAP